MKPTVLAALLAMAVSACGGGPAPSEPDEPAEVSLEDERARTVELAGGEELVLVADWVGDPSSNLAGYGVEGEEVTSPGPTIRVRMGETVTITFENAHYWEDGRPFTEPHNLTVVADKDEPVWEMQPLWDANAGGLGTEGLAPGDRASTTFTPSTGGTFYYVCAYSDHIDHGMWGRFVVEG